MKKEQVEVGGTYSAKVGTQVVPVRITAEKWLGDKHAGWVATNTTTGRTVRIKSAQRLRREVGAKPATAAKNAATNAATSEVATEAKAVAPNATDAKVGEAVASGAEVVATAGSPKPPKGAKGKQAKDASTRDAKQRAKAPAKDDTKKDATPKRTSALDAAAQVLAASKEPLNCKQLVAEMEAKGLWKSPSGKTPEASVYAAVIREIAAKGRESRFRKTDRGLFTAAKG
ncbi:MAG: winged helix-turn-helix domain-containing protein [Phycisphaerales bacterium]